MRNSFFRMFMLGMGLTTFTGWTSIPSSTSTSFDTLSRTKTESADPNKTFQKRYHVLITSDMHYSSLHPYSVDKDTRLQLWVDGILAEHERDPFDSIIILGDMSLDYWGWNGGGSWQRDPRVSETKLFMEKYFSQLPKEVPTLVMPGNHELYTNEAWKELTGNNRNETFVLGNNLFIIPDSYAGAVDPVYQGGGINDSPYECMNMEFINNALDAHPECTNVFLLSHHFDLSKESTAFKNLLKNDKRIVGLLSGHTHQSTGIALGSEYRDLFLAQTGAFLSQGKWGYRDIIINDQNIVSNFIIPQCEYEVDGTKYSFARKTIDIVKMEPGKK